MSQATTTTNMQIAEEIAIPAAAGRMAAVLHTPYGPSRGLAVIFCHGFRGSKEGGGRAASLAARVAAMGYVALRFAFTPLRPLSTQIDELRTAVAYCRRSLSRRIILFGRSMGGSAALAVAAAGKDICGLVLWSTPHDLRETFRLSLRDGYDRLVGGETLSIADEFGRLTLEPAFLRDFDRFDLLGCARLLTGRPILVVHGERDEIVPLRQAEEIYNQATEPKKLVVIPGGDHRFLDGYDLAADAVLAWLAAFPQGRA